MPKSIKVTKNALISMLFLSVVYVLITLGSCNVYAEADDECTVTFHANREGVVFWDGQKTITRDIGKKGEIVKLVSFNHHYHYTDDYVDPSRSEHMFYPVPEYNLDLCEGKHISKEWFESPPDNMYLKGWSINQNATVPDKEIVISDNMNLYAVWGNLYKVRVYSSKNEGFLLRSDLQYNLESRYTFCTIMAAGGTFECNMACISDNENDIRTSSETGCVRYSGDFLGWSTKPNATNPEKSIIIDRDMSIYAVDKPHIHSFTEIEFTDRKSTYTKRGKKTDSKCCACGAYKKGEELPLLSLKKGVKLTIANNKYSVINVKSRTLALVTAKNVKTYTVPATVKFNGKKYKIVQINKGALKGKKIKKVTIGKNIKVLKKGSFSGSGATDVTIKSKHLKASKIKGCLKGSKVKTIRVKVSSSKKQNQTYLKKYKKIFTKKNVGKNVKLKLAN